MVTHKTAPPSVYVGISEGPLRLREATHVQDYYKWKRGTNLRHACHSRDILEIDLDARIELLESGIHTREEARWRERYWYDKKKEDGFNVTNRCRPRITKDEERETKRESERRNPKTEAQKQRKKETDHIRHQSDKFKRQNLERTNRLRQDPVFRAKRNQQAGEYRARKKAERAAITPS
jgi:hypothetical protein